jgi:hypothetical protein
MGAKLATALIAGMFFTFFLDFFFILGLFLHYIQAQDIDVYYNILFADHQNIFVFGFGVLVFGYLFIFVENTKIGALIFAISFLLINLTLIPFIGKKAGVMMFEKDNQIMKEGTQTFIGHTVYEGRKTTWFYDDDLKKIITFKKGNEI